MPHSDNGIDHFSLSQVVLQDQVELEGEDSEAITAYLELKVEHMIQTASKRAVAGREAMLPLIRLRVGT